MIYKKFKYLKYIITRIDWSLSNNLEEMFKAGKLKVVDRTLKGEWGFDVDLHEERQWSTHDGCRDAQLTIQKGKIILELTYYRGNSFDGRREGLKWNAKFSGLNGNTIKMFTNSINYQFYQQMEYLFLEEEEAKKQKRITELEIEKLNLKK